MIADESCMEPKLTFIDLFAGIGGFHIAFKNAGAHCVFTSEWDKHARNTYFHNFKEKDPHLFGSNPEEETPYFVGDITKITTKLDADNQLIPDFNILTGGFPCQPFSQAGLKKGMEETRGTLFFDILKILEVKRPEAFFLENVRGLLKHESPGGIKTLEVIKNKIASLGYHSDVYLVKASDYGVPQRRERIFIIGFKDKEKMEKFILPPKKDLIYSLDAVLGGTTNRTLGYTLRVGGRGSGLGDRRNWDTYLVNGNEKRIGPSEGLKLQGFPSWFRFPDGLPETQAMKQLGNSVAVPAIEAFANEIVRVIST